MKHLVKNTFILVFSIFFILLSIKSSYAEDKVKLLEIISTSNKTVELKFDKNISEKWDLKSDLEIYRNLWNTPTKDLENTKKVILTLDWVIENNTSYSLISISWVEWSIIFKTWNNLLWSNIQNDDIDSDSQWIKNIVIKKANTLDINFSNNVESSDLEFQLYKTIEVEKIQNISSSNKINVLLKKEIKNNSEYLGTLTYLESPTLKKNEVEKWIYYFTTKDLRQYNESTDFVSIEWGESKSDDEESLEDTLMNALGDSEILNSEKWDLLEWEKEIIDELKSASEDPENVKKTQLEKLALNQKETPDSGAETWVLILGTFILNTLYFLSRRKKSIK